MKEASKRARTQIAMLVAACLILFSLAIAGGALVQRFDQTNDRRATQSAFNARITELATSDCLDIEKLKTNVRNKANEDFRNLSRNAKLLGITLTPAIIEQARADRAATLETYAKQPCPRPRRTSEVR